jgi:putative ABC transport system ATP-binding protein
VSAPEQAVRAAERERGSAAITVVDVRKSYRRGRETVHALWDVSTRIDVGEMVVLLGRSGSGKTTLLNCIAGWERPDAGAIELAEAPGRLTEWQQVAVVPQRLGLLEELSLAENVAMPARLAGLDDAGQRVRALLDDLGIAHLAGRAPAEVSLGEQQRAAIARALVVRPRVLLADEPTGRLDEELSAAVLDIIRRLCAEHGTAALIASHDPLAVVHAHRVLRMQDGRLDDAATETDGPIDPPAPVRAT